MDLDVVRGLVRNASHRWGPNVRARREALGLTQAQLVELIDGIAVQTVSKIEIGRIVPRDYLKVAIATALHVEPDVLFPLPSRSDVLAVTSLGDNR